MENKSVKPTWIRTSKRLPDSFQKVLTFRRGRISLGSWGDRGDMPDGAYWIIDGAAGGFGTELEVKPPTYWMPLPEPPK